MLFVNEDKRASSCYSDWLHSKADTCLNVVTSFKTVQEFQFNFEHMKVETNFIYSFFFIPFLHSII